MANRKLGRATDQRLALLKNQVSQFLWLGRLETTYARAKEIQKIAEKYITLAINTYQDTVEVQKTKVIKGVDTKVTVLNDGGKKLAARRKLMAGLCDLQEAKLPKETKLQYKVRTKDVKHPLIEKMFNDYAPRFDKRAQELGQRGGYTTLHKIGLRRGDAAEAAIIEIIG